MPIIKYNITVLSLTYNINILIYSDVVKEFWSKRIEYKFIRIWTVQLRKKQ